MAEIAFSDLCGFFQRQWEATAAADGVRYFLYGGSRGPGKSHWLRWYLVRRLLRWGVQGFRSVRVGLFCEDYPSLKERQIVKIQAQFPRWLGALKETKSDGLGFHLRPEYGGGVIALRNLDDPSKYQSAEFAGMAVDELTKNTESTFHQLRGSLRWPGMHDTFFVAASNPNGKGQKWVRAYFVERQLPPELKGHEADFAFLPASPRDNPFLDTSYWEMLDTLPDVLRRAWRDGDWYVTMEGIVYPEFGAENLTDEEPDPALPIELAADDGYVDPRAILFIQRTGTRILVYDEIYHSRHLAEVCVGEVVQKCGDRFGWADEEKTPKRLAEICVGPSESKELQRRFQAADISYREGTHQVIEGIKVVRRLICDGQGYRAMQVNRRCRNLIRELTEGYQYPPEGSRGDDEKPVDGSDHACFVAGTMIQTKLGLVPIENIRPGDDVLTRLGYRKVIESGMTRQRANVMTVLFSNGVSLTGTPNHPVFVQGNGYTPLRALRYGDIILATRERNQEVSLWQWLMSVKAKLSNTRGLISTVTPIQNGEQIGCTLPHHLMLASKALIACIKRSGRTCTALYQRAITFITKMRTHSIMPLIILNYGKGTSTYRGTERMSLMKSKQGGEQHSRSRVRQHRNGMALRMVWPGIQLWVRRLGLIVSQWSMYAITAALRLKPWPLTVAPVSAQTIASPNGDGDLASTTRHVPALSVVSNTPSTDMRKTTFALVSVVGTVANNKPESVYNLAVDNAVGEYFANGILCRNCDALRYWAWVRARR